MKYQVIKDFLHPDVAERIASHIQSVKADKWKHYYKFGSGDRPIYSDNTIKDEFLKQKLATAQFYKTQILPRNQSHLEAILEDSEFIDNLKLN
jgi:hypothetical protein